MEIEDIFKDVCQVIEDSIGTPADSIKLEDTLFDELGVDSIDLVDILFELETLYEMELKISDIEQSIGRILRSKPEDRIITPLVIDIVDDFSIFTTRFNKRLTGDDFAMIGRQNPTATIPTAQSLGAVEFAPRLDNEINNERINPDILSAFKSNPYAQSLNSSI